MTFGFAVEHEPREPCGVVGGPEPEADEVAPRPGPRPRQDRLDAMSPGKLHQTQRAYFPVHHRSFIG